MKNEFKYTDDRFAGKKYYSMTDLAKILNIPKMGRNNIIKFLREEKVLDQYGNPEKQFRGRGYFKAKSGFDPILATPEGAEFIASLLEK